MSLMEEINGEKYRVEIENVYEKKEVVNTLSNKSVKIYRNRSKSLLKVIEENKSGEDNLKLLKSETSNVTNDFNPQYNLQESISTLINMTGITNLQQNSANLNKNINNNLNMKMNMNNYEDELMQNINYDLSEIKTRFDQKRKLRSEHECLREGNLIFLDTYDEKGNINSNDILAFVRKTEREEGIFIFNFKDKEISFILDLSPLIGNLKETNPNLIFNVEDWNGDEKKVELYFFKEITQGFANQTIEAYSSLCYGFSSLPYTQENYRKTLENKNNRNINKDIEKRNRSKRFSVPNISASIKLQREIINDINANVNKQENLDNVQDIIFMDFDEKKENKIDIRKTDYYKKVTGKYKNWFGIHHSNDNISKQLKDILNQKLSLKDFSDWFNNVIISMETDDLNSYILSLGCLNQNEELDQEFFKYCYNLSKSKTKGFKYTFEAEKLYNANQLGIICFITPELGRWSTVGGLGIMVDELSQGLRSLGQDVIMISPYYYKNRKGETDYLKDDPFNIQFLKNISINLDTNYTFKIYYGEGNEGIKYYFIENKDMFPEVYPNFNTPDTLREIAGFAKCSLQLLKDLDSIPSIILTNDWFTGLVPAYGKNNSFGDAYKSTKFIHICHNLEDSYEGRLYFNGNENYRNIFQFNPSWLIDPKSRTVINPSRCAILKSDQWATVSRSYKKQLMATSSLAELLNKKQNPFAFPNGVFIKKRLQYLKEETGGSKMECKKYIQLNYFGYDNPDYSVPIYSFVGRLTQQKGVLMIIDLVEDLIKETNGKINILIGGTGILNDGYVQTCIHKMNYLRDKYPFCFWANPTEFFTDGPKINLGSDFGLMPSQFEPGGIVQHEFFIAGTPVIAYKTGGLKDTVFEFNYQTNTGNGITFENYTQEELLNAILRSIELFNNKEKYNICRRNAFKSTIDVYDVSKAWCKEFCRLKHKIFLNKKEVQDLYMSQIPDKDLIEVKQDKNDKRISYTKYNNLNREGNFMNNNSLRNIYHGKRYSVNYNDLKTFQSGRRILDSMNQLRNNNIPNINNNNINRINNNNINLNNSSNINNNINRINNNMNLNNSNNMNNNINRINNNNMNLNRPNNNNNRNNKFYTVMGNDEVVKTFSYHFPGKQPLVVELSGSFDNWTKKHRLIHKTRDNKFELSMKLKKGKYLYKYIVDGNWQINPSEASEQGRDGIINNVVIL